ncbi:MAG: transposase [Patescibacteria group bacterium]
MSIKRTSHSLYDLWYHFAWSTKYRKEIFKNRNIVYCAKTILRAIAGHYDITIQDQYSQMEQKLLQ